MCEKTLLKNHELVIEKFLEGNKVIDNHTGNSIKVAGVITFANKENGIGAIIKSKYCYYINELYYNDNDNVLHLSEYSIGGMLFRHNSSDELVKQIEKYNESNININKINRVIDKDGLIIFSRD